MTVGYCYYLIERRGVGGLIFPLLALFLGGDYFRKEFCASKWVGLDNKKKTAF